MYLAIAMSASVSIIRLAECFTLRLIVAVVFTLFLVAACVGGTGTHETFRRAQQIQPMVETSGTILIRVVKEASGRIPLSFFVFPTTVLLPSVCQVVLHTAAEAPLLTPLRLGLLFTCVTSSFL